MSRTMIEIPMHTNDVNSVLNVIHTILSAKGYVNKLVDGENVWVKGDAVVSSMKCFGAIFTGHSVVVQAWMKNAVTGESDLSGFIGVLPRKRMKHVLDNIGETLTSMNL
ncbi:MAG: hypothetical protein Q4F05_13935 [bacterium]|nr:hypothetical protein [bacterium]